MLFLKQLLIHNINELKYQIKNLNKFKEKPVDEILCLTRNNFIFRVFDELPSALQIFFSFPVPALCRAMRSHENEINQKSTTVKKIT